MAEGIVYLDVDDEITSAASRIRTSPATKVALVVPYGSRIATSRMNFRLLSREAVVSNRRLSIVSGDAAARSLAASAGLPVFGTVGEYESSVAGPRSTQDDAGHAMPARAPVAVDALPDGDAAAAPSDPSGAIESPIARSETVVAATPSADRSVAVRTRTSQRPRRPPTDPAARAGAGPSATQATAPAAAAVAASAARSARPADATAVDDDAVAGLPPLFGTRIRAPIAAAIGVVALALVVVAAGAYVFLPAATITLVPKREPIGPLQLTVAADPSASAVDATALVVPAVRVDVPVEASDTFTTSGVHVEQTPARGSVTFENYNPVSANTVPSGSIVSTEGGIRFRTRSSVTIPAGTFVLPSVIPSRRSVDVEAVEDGPGGNVPANAIRVVPQGENPDFLKVNNPDPTTGGKRVQTPEVKKAEVDEAVATVQADLERVFQEAVDGGAVVPPGTTLFQATARLGPVTPEADPQSLVGQAVESFEIRLTATGSVIAVDPSPVTSLAESLIASRVTAGHRLVPGSTVIDPGDGVVGEDGQVSFLVTAQATQTAVVDPTALRPLVKGKTAAEATAALAPYGVATVELWPEWATAVTGIDGRLTITIEAAAAEANGPGASAGPSAAPSARPSPSRRPSGSPSAIASPVAS